MLKVSELKVFTQNLDIGMVAARLLLLHLCCSILFTNRVYFFYMWLECKKHEYCYSYLQNQEIKCGSACRVWIRCPRLVEKLFDQQSLINGFILPTHDIILLLLYYYFEFYYQKLQIYTSCIDRINVDRHNILSKIQRF